ncbi:hypothetical protein AgCh_004554 [Apium graveolens]
MDEKLSSYESKLIALREELSSNKEQATQYPVEMALRMDGLSHRIAKMDNCFDKLKRLISGMQPSSEKSAPKVPTHIERVDIEDTTEQKFNSKSEEYLEAGTQSPRRTLATGFQLM